MIYCSVKYCCSNSSILGVIVHSIMKSIKTPNHPDYNWSTLWPLEVWVRGLYNSWWFCVHKLSMFIYLSMTKTLLISNRRNRMLFTLFSSWSWGRISSDTRLQSELLIFVFLIFLPENSGNSSGNWNEVNFQELDFQIK